MGEIREDGYLNAVTNAGVVGKDKKQAGGFVARKQTYKEYADIYTSSGLGHKIATGYPDYMMKKGITFTGDTDGKYPSYLDKMGWTYAFHMALVWSYVFGPSCILVGALDGQAELDQPLNENNIKSIPWLKVYDAREMSITSTDFDTDPTSDTFGKPLYITISASDSSITGQRVHASRLLFFKGVPSDKETADLLEMYFGDSFYRHVFDALRATESIFSNVETIMQDFVVWKVKIGNLVQLLQAGQESQVKKRVEMINYAKSVMNAVVHGEEEEISSQTTSVAGVDSVIDRFMMYLSGITGYPVSLLFGRGAQGMNATGEGDKTNFYDNVQSAQEIKIKPNLDRLLKLISLAKDFNGPSFEEISYEFNPLEQQSEKEIAETRKITAESDQIYMLQGVVTPEEIRQSRFGGEEYSQETVIDESLNLEDFNSSDNLDSLEGVVNAE